MAGTITETSAWGFVRAAARHWCGLRGDDVLELTREIDRIMLTRHPECTITTLGFGSPIGIDARWWGVDRGIPPVIHTGIAHRTAGTGQLGAEIARVMLDCFVDAVREFGWRRGIEGTA